MKQSSQFGSSPDHAKPFIVAIGIAFTFLALVVLYIAFSKGGFDIRSRAASAASCRNRVPNPNQSKCFDVNCSRITNRSSCDAKTDSTGKKCCVWSAAIVPTSKPTIRISTYPSKKPTSTNMPTNRPTYRPTPTQSSKLQRIIIGPSSPPRKPSYYPTP